MGDLSDSGTVLDEGIREDGEEPGFLDRVFRTTPEETEGVIGLIRGSVDPSRFFTFTSSQNGVITVQWKNNLVLRPCDFCHLLKIE